MAPTKTVVAAPDQFEATLTAALAKDGTAVYALFTGAGEPSWCPDCVRADPVVEKALASLAADEAALLVCPCERSSYKGNPDFLYRTHPQAKIKGVPTLVKYSSSGKIVGSLCEAQLFTEAPILDLIEA